MNHEIAKKLKDAGFPQGEPDQYTTDGQWIPEDERQYIPSLSELIDACYSPEYDEAVVVAKYDTNRYAAWLALEDAEEVQNHYYESSTAEEAVANLYIALHGKTTNN